MKALLILGAVFFGLLLFSQVRVGGTVAVCRAGASDPDTGRASAHTGIPCKKEERETIWPRHRGKTRAEVQSGCRCGAGAEGHSGVGAAIFASGG